MRVCSILLKKIYHYGIRDTGLKWFQSYLSDVEYLKDPYWAHYMFSIYINDLSTFCQQTITILFADDTKLFIIRYNLLQMVKTLNAELYYITFQIG